MIKVASRPAGSRQRRSDVSDDHVSRLPAKLHGDSDDLVHTAGQVDFRPGILFSLGNRRFDHWTPQYLRYRIRPQRAAAALHPEEPSLTPQSITQSSNAGFRADGVGAE